MRETGADIGFAHDGDADGFVIVTDSGVALSGEWTYAFVADFILSKTKGDIVATVSTSRMLDDIAARRGVTLHRTKVGVGWVVEKMHEVNAVSEVKVRVVLSTHLSTILQMVLPLLQQLFSILLNPKAQ